MAVEYDELFGVKSSISCLPYRNNQQVGVCFRQGSRNNFFMIPLQTAKQAVTELQTAIEQVENGRITE